MTNYGEENYGKRRGENMSVLFSELLVPGWADNKIGLADVTGTYSDGSSFNLPCHTADPQLFFSEVELQVSEAKTLCGRCPVQAQCLSGALSRLEPAGVWGGELFEAGRIIAKKRKAGRPTRKEIAARNVKGELIELKVAKSEREESAA